MRRPLAGIVALLAVGVAVPAQAQLLEAARSGDFDRVRTLAASGADVNEARGDGMTALHLAAEAGQARVVATLVSEGASVEAGTRIGGYTPLHLAARGGHAGIVSALLEGKGRTPTQSRRRAG